MYCKNCGNKLNENEKFCANCGMTIESNLNANNTEKQINNTNNTNKKTSKWVIISIILGVIAFLSFSAIIIGTLFDDSTGSKELLKQLEEKYHEEFQVTKFGGRDFLNATGKFYAYPKNNPKILFEAWLPEGNLSDNYVDHIIYFEVQNKIEEGLKEKGIESVANAMIVDFSYYFDNERNAKIISYDEYKEQYPFDDFFVEIAINKEDINNLKDDIQQVFLDVSKELDKKITTTIYTFNSNDYQNVEKYFRDNVSIDSSIDDYSPIKEYALVVDKDVCIRFDED